MTKEQFINWLILKFYESDGKSPIKLDDGSVITKELMAKILDALKG